MGEFRAGSTVAGNRIWHEGNFDPNSKSNEGHGHSISDISNLQSKLDSKENNLTFDGVGGIDISRTDDTITIDTSNVGNYTVNEGLRLDEKAFSHADTSSQSSSTNSGRTYIQDVTLDKFGHVTGLSTATETVTDSWRDIDNTPTSGATSVSISSDWAHEVEGILAGKADVGRTISAGTGLTGGGDLSSNRTISFDVDWGDERYLTQRIAEFAYDVTIDADADEVPIDIPEYVDGTDRISIYVGGVFQTIDKEVEIFFSNEENMYCLRNLEGTWSSGTDFDFIVTKNTYTSTPEDEIDAGLMLKDGTVSRNKLTAQLTNEIDQKAEQSSVDNLTDEVDQKADKEDLDRLEESTVNLQNGYNEVQSDNVTTAHIKFEGNTKINYAPPFTSTFWGTHMGWTVTDTKATLDTEAWEYIDSDALHLKPSTQYRVKFDNINHGNVFIYDFNQSRIGGENHTNLQTDYTFTSPSDGIVYIQLNATDTGGAHVVENLEIVEDEFYTEGFIQGIQPIRHPVITAKGKNLAKPLYYWNVHNNATILDPYKLELNASQAWEETTLNVKVEPNTTYNFLVDPDGEEEYFAVRSIYFDGTINTQALIEGPIYNTGATFTVPSDITEVQLVLTKAGSGKAVFSNMQLETGDSSFEPYEESQFLIQENFFKEDKLLYDNGRYKKEENMFDIEIDGSFEFNLSSTQYNGSKRILLRLFNNNHFPTNVFSDSPELYNAYLVDSSGVFYEQTEFHDELLESEQFTLYEAGSGDTLNMTIPISKTGWKDSWNTPSRTFEESTYGTNRDFYWHELISAYLNGWKFRDNPNGSGTSYWQSMYDSSIESSIVDEVITRNMHQENGGHGYRLIFQRSEPLIKEIKGGLHLHKGMNNVEVSSGLVIEEVANTYHFDESDFNEYQINHEAHSKLNYKLEEVVSVFENGKEFNYWTPSSNNAYGNVKIRISNTAFDPTATYAVMYRMLDTNTVPLQSANLTVAESIRSTVSDVVKQSTENSNDIARINSFMPMMQNAIFEESGSNSDGRYIKFSDGTLICISKPIRLDHLSDRFFGGDWHLPVSLIDDNFEETYVSVSLRTNTSLWSNTDNRGSVSFPGTNNLHEDMVNLRVYMDGTPITSGDTVTVNAFLIGRWKYEN